MTRILCPLSERSIKVILPTLKKNEQTPENTDQSANRIIVQRSYIDSKAALLLMLRPPRRRNTTSSKT